MVLLTFKGKKWKKDEVCRLVKRLLTKYCTEDELAALGGIKNSHRLIEDFQLSYFEELNLFAEIESAFNISFSAKLILDINTVQDLCEAIIKQINA